MTSTGNEDALKALESMLKHCDERSLSPEDTNYGHYLAKTIRTALIRSAQVDGLVKAFEKLTDTLECADICDCGNYDVSKQDAREARKALTQFTTKEKI